jgi:hypothetical protein
MHTYEVHARISWGVYLIGVYFIGVHLIGVHLMGVHLLWIISPNNLCAKLPRRRIRLALNSHSKSLPRSIPLCNDTQGVFRLLIVGDSAVRLLVTLGARSAW